MQIAKISGNKLAPVFTTEDGAVFYHQGINKHKPVEVPVELFDVPTHKIPLAVLLCIESEKYEGAGFGDGLGNTYQLKIHQCTKQDAQLQIWFCEETSDVLVVTCEDGKEWKKAYTYTAR